MIALRLSMAANMKYELAIQHLNLHGSASIAMQVQMGWALCPAGRLLVTPDLSPMKVITS